MSRSAIHHNSPLSTRASVNVRSNAIENNDDSVVTMREASTTTTTTGNRARSLSEFDLSLMPRGRIFPRTLHQWSVHHSLTTSNWIATISRPDPTDSQKMKYVQFPFSTEREARKFCNCFAPPKLCVGIQECMLCQQPKARHCRNCGASVCGRCSTRWGARMVPKTYMNIQSLTVSVCKSCDWLSNAFCMALLQGRFQDVQQIYQTGNVNLRTSFADIHREAMYVLNECMMCLWHIEGIIDTRVGFSLARIVCWSCTCSLCTILTMSSFSSSSQFPGPLRCHGWQPSYLAVARRNALVSHFCS
jgi:hypothetical protein